jgi:hypothetical protein
VTRSKKPAEKLSPEFASRLDRLEPRAKVQAIVLLRTAEIDGSSGRRQNRTERAATVEAMHYAAEQALANVDGILERHHGQRLAGGNYRCRYQGPGIVQMGQGSA